MKFYSSFSKCFFLLVFLFVVTFGTAYSQVLSYTTNSSGVLNSVATNATGTSLVRVNGASAPGAPCGTGFSSAGFTGVTTYSSGLPAIEVTATANSGYDLAVTGFSVDLRRSSSGPASVRLAYSIDGGTTWVDQGTNQAPNNGPCGTTSTGTWSTSVTVSGTIKFRVYGFNSSSTTGTFQVQNLIINGTVVSASGCGLSSGLAASSITTSGATLSWAAVGGAISYNIQYRQVGTSSWTPTTSAVNSVAVSGLTAGTTYEFQVQTVCSGSVTSPFTSSSDFTTSGGSTSSGSTGKIAIYFNNPVNTTVSTGVNAVYLPNTFADTIIAYINRAKYSIDIAQYDYNQSSGYANIATAVNNAYLSGKKVRWIYDGSQPNTGIALLNAGIQTLASPTTSAYNIMHNKFIIIDANSTNPDDAVVSTGSEDWGITQLNTDRNNLLFIQDSSLAHAYLNEFNMMWGDTGAAPNTTLSKFGPYKTDLGAHIFHIGGKLVELYFSPSDGTDSHIQSAINSANTDLYFGVYDFTVAADANAIVARKTAGVYTAGIVDQYSNTGAAYPILTSGLGSSLITYASSSLVYHHKMVIVDPSNSCSDPQVLTGSHNWTTSANTKNDENTLIIHNDTIANIYYQAFYADYNALGGSLTAIAPCITVGCGSPIGLFATTITASSALLNWGTVSGAISYTIQYRQVGTSTWSTTTSSADTITVSGLTASTNYEFQVSATCASGAGSYSSTSGFTTLAPPCSVPTGLSASGITSASATLIWDAVSGAVSYSVQYRPVGTSTWSTTTSAVNSVTISGLTPGTAYEFQVEVVCASGTSGFSGSSIFTTLAVTCPLPTGLSASSITMTSAQLNWSAAAGAGSYSISYRPVGTSGWSYTTAAGTSVVVTGLASATSYEFQVQSICSATDSSGYTSSALFTTLGLSCATPIGLTSAVTATTATLSWTAVTGAVSYHINYHVSGAPGWSTVTSFTNSVTLTLLPPATHLQFEVQSVCSSVSSDTSTFSTIADFTTAATTGLPVTSLVENSFVIYPNPVTQDAAISYSLISSSEVSVTVYDLVGHEINKVVAAEPQAAGKHSYIIQIATPGIYFIKLTCGGESTVRKVIKL